MLQSLDLIPITTKKQNPKNLTTTIAKTHDHHYQHHQKPRKLQNIRPVEGNNERNSWAKQKQSQSFKEFHA
jgi:hypothetical protein